MTTRRPFVAAWRLTFAFPCRFPCAGLLSRGGKVYEVIPGRRVIHVLALSAKAVVKASKACSALLVLPECLM